MTHHASANPRRVPPKPREKGAAHTAVHHERRHKSMEGRYGVIGTDATLTDVSWQSNDGGGDPTNYYPGVVLDTNGLTAYNSGGTVTMTISDADGSITIFGSGTITGAVIQTSASNPRTVMNSSGIQSYDSLGNQTFNLGGGQLSVSGQSTITGGTIRTSAGNPRVEMNTGGLYAYNSLGTQTAFISSSDGSVTISGNLSVTGTSTITGGTIQTAATSSSRVVMDVNGLRAYDNVGNNTFNLTTSGSLSLYMGSSSTASITLGSAVGGSTGTRVVIDPLGIHAYDATNVQRVNIDATSGLITATGVITANPGSTVPWQTTGFFVGGDNLLGNASAEDPTSVTQTLYFNPNSVTAGTFTLQYGALTVTSALNWNSTAAQVQTALQAAGVLPSGFAVACSGGPLPGTPITLTLSGSATPAATVISVASQSLTGGTAIVGAVPLGWSVSGGALDYISYPNAFHGGQVFRLSQVFSSSPSPQIIQIRGPFGLVAGTSYTLSAYFSAPTANRTAQLIITWLDGSGGTVASSSTNSPWNTTSNWQRLITTSKVPTAATRQQISITGGPTAGTFTLTYNGQTTAAINWNATSSQVLTALQALGNVGSTGVGFATGGPLPGTPVKVSFVSPPAAAPATLTATSSLTGGTSPGVSIANQVASQVQATAGIFNAVQGNVFYVDAVQLEVADAPTGFKPRADEILANTIQANMINVALLSAISANMGTITAGTITGAVVRSSAGNPRMEMNPSGVFGYDASGNQTVSLGGSTNTITGATVQTASSGSRVVLDGSANAIKIYNSAVSSTSPVVSLDPTSGLNLYPTSSLYGSVSWRQPVSNKVVGEIWVTPSGSNTMFSNWRVTLDSTPNLSEIEMVVSTISDTSSGVTARAANAANTILYQARIIDGSGASDFLQLGNTANSSASGSRIVKYFGPYHIGVSLSIVPGDTTILSLNDAQFNLTAAKGWQTNVWFTEGAWMDACGWAQTSVNASTNNIGIAVHNNGSGTATGDAWASILIFY